MTFKHFIVRCLGPVQRGIMAVARWGGSDLGPNEDNTPMGKAPYTEPVGYINPAIFFAAERDQLDAPPQVLQAELNACLETVRVRSGASLAMLGSLSIKYPPEEALARVFANYLLTGIYLERRYASGDRPDNIEA